MYFFFFVHSVWNVPPLALLIRVPPFTLLVPLTLRSRTYVLVLGPVHVGGQLLPTAKWSIETRTQD